MQHIYLIYSPEKNLGNDGTTRTVIVEQEGQNIRLQCLAFGNPPPLIMWQRTDGKLIGMEDYQGTYCFYD